jgi:mannose-1-phosphate guanylyltransferase
MTTEHSHRHAVILAGGRGTRLWPISTAKQPKQFQALGDSRSLIAQTFDRLASVVGDERIFVSTTAGYVDDVIAALPRLSRENLIVEPRPEGKPAAFLLIANRIYSKDPLAVVFSAAADSSVSPLSVFQESCAGAFQFVESYPFWTTILGVRPTRADSSLGYIRARGAAMGVKGIYVARDFEEKPTRESTESLVAKPDYFWNSSHYCFSVSTLLEAYKQAAPELFAAVDSYNRTELEAEYESKDAPGHELLPLINGGWPIGVMACDFRWYDIGTWPSLYRALQDSQGTKLITSGAHIDLESDGGLVVNDSSMTVVTAGLNDLAVIVSNSVVLVAPIRKLEDQPDTIAYLQSKYAGLADQREKTK